jgi:hypothetical protein
VTGTLYLKDKELTIKNRDKLVKNKNLLYWYGRLYESTIGCIPDHQVKKILEIGSGTSPLKMFYPGILTSDILELDYLDYVFDCQKINESDFIADGSLDCISLTNVLHHLKDPVDFLLRAEKKLKDGGSIIFTEPYLSALSSPIYKYLHPEGVDCSVKEPILSFSEGPLSSANQAIPYLVFFKNEKWRDRLLKTYTLGKATFFTSLSYFMTGGISRKLPVPRILYKVIFKADQFLARHLPKLLASFFTMTLTKKEAEK